MGLNELQTNAYIAFQSEKSFEWSFKLFIFSVLHDKCIYLAG